MPDTPEFRIQAADHMLAGEQWDRTPPEPAGPFDRYMALVTAVNNAPRQRFPFEWLAAALRASRPTGSLICTGAAYPLDDAGHTSTLILQVTRFRRWGILSWFSNLGAAASYACET